MGKPRSTISIFLFNLSILLNYYVKAELKCSEWSYQIESHAVTYGQILEETELDNLKDCLQLCNKNPHCSSVNYLLDVNMSPQCQLIDTSVAGIPTKLPVAEHVIYSGRKFCVPAKFTEMCPERSWAFEKFPNRELIKESFITESQHTESVETCLILCAQSDNCMSALYNRVSGECSLSVATLQAVYNTRNFYRFNENVDLYENNCIQQPSLVTTCSFLSMKSAGIIDHYDERIFAVPNKEACERECLTRVEREALCRMYTFDSSTMTCYLNHVTAKIIGRNPMGLNDKHLSTGELDDCIEFALKCKTGSLELHGNSMKLFSGQLRTKKGKEIVCQKNISADYDFDMEIPYDRCGIEKKEFPISSYSGLLHLKEGSTDLVTIRDKIIQIHCRIHTQMEQSEQTLSVAMNVMNGNNTRLHKGLILPAAATRTNRPITTKPKFTLDVMKSGSAAEHVNLGEKGHLVIRINRDLVDSADFSIRNLVAQDVSLKTKYILIDEDGCVVDRDIITSIRRINADELDIELQFTGFPHKTEVVYQALVEPCNFNCYPQCNKDLFIGDLVTNRRSRNRRAAQNGRQFEISQDVYKVRGHRIEFLTPSPIGTVVELGKLGIEKTVNREKIFVDDSKVPEDVQVTEVASEPLSTSITRCVREDVSCLFTLLLACLQLLLLVSCVFIVYFYVRQWRTYRMAQRSQSTSDDAIQYEISLNNHNEK